MTPAQTAAICATLVGAVATAGAASESARPIPTPIWGVTTDGISPLSSIVTSLDRFAKTPTTRVVFDEYVPALQYEAALKEIHPVSYVMGELLDSVYVKHYSVPEYKKRAKEYVETLGDYVDIWEIGNEINGEWLGGTPSVVRKMTGAFDIARAAGARTALTLYYNPDCWSSRSHEMFTWAEKNVPPRMKQGLDYIWVSYYEDDCSGYQPDWQAVFDRLALIFPSSKLGIGECGTTDAAKKAAYVRRYYSMKIDRPNYAGGYFWWYFRQDMVPYTKPLWSVLNRILRSDEGAVLPAELHKIDAGGIGGAEPVTGVGEEYMLRRRIDRAILTEELLALRLQ